MPVWCFDTGWPRIFTHHCRRAGIYARVREKQRGQRVPALPSQCRCGTSKMGIYALPYSTQLRPIKTCPNSDVLGNAGTKPFGKTIER